MKRLSGTKTKGRDFISQINVGQFSDLSKPEQANAINSAFLEPLDQYRLQEPLTRFPLEDEPEFLSVSEERLLKVLSNLHTRKASGPDNMLNWLLEGLSRRSPGMGDTGHFTNFVETSSV